MYIDIFTKKKTCSWGTPSPKSTNIVRCAFSKSQEGSGQPLWVRPHAQSSIFGPSQCPLFVPVFAHNQSSRKLEESAKQWQMLARDFCIMNVFQEWSKKMDQWMKMIENAWKCMYESVWVQIIESWRLWQPRRNGWYSPRMEMNGMYAMLWEPSSPLQNPGLCLLKLQTHSCLHVA